MAKVLELQLQHQSFQWIQGWFPLGWLVGSPCCPKDSQESSPARQSESKVLRCSVFFMVQLSHPSITTGKTIALTRWTFVNKIMSFLICCLGWSWLFFQGASVLISWLQSQSAVILEPKKIKSVTVSTFHPFICHEVMGPDGLISDF